MSVTLESRPLRAYLPLPIDQHPRLLPTITHDYAEQVVDWLDADKEGASDERTKLKLLRCKQCRDARKMVVIRNMLYEHLH